MSVLKRMLPTAVGMAVGLFVLASVFTTNPWLDAIGNYFVDTAILIAAFALFLGLLNVVRVHALKIRERQPGRFSSFFLLAVMLLVLALGLPPSPDRPSGPAQPAVQWIFQNVQAPIQASLSALLVFFIATASYRMLRTRRPGWIILWIVALLVLLGQVSVGIFPVLSDLKDWILDVPAIAGVRGIVLGVSLGALLTSIRLLLGVERPYSD